MGSGALIRHLMDVGLDLGGGGITVQGWVSAGLKVSPLVRQ